MYSGECTESGSGGDAIKDHRRRRMIIKSSLKSMDSSSSSSQMSVRFSTVDVRDYSLCLGDNPSVSRGAPISLDWDYVKENSYELNSYECERFHGRRIDKDQFKRPSLQRIQLLKNLGYSRGEINEQTKKMQLVRQQRISTIRRTERTDRIKAFVRGIAKTFFCKMQSISSSPPLPPFPQKSKQCSCDLETKDCKRTCHQEPDEDTLASSSSSNNDILATENC